MSVLGNIANRLQTDLADIGRATVDPAFSARLDASQAEDKQFKRNRKIEVEDASAQREQVLQDQEKAFRLKSQLFATQLVTQEGLKSGDWSGLARLNQNPDLDPNIRHQSELIINAAIPQGTEWALKRGELAIKARNSTSRELANMLKVGQMEQTDRHFAEKMLLEKNKFEDEHLSMKRDELIESGDITTIKNFFKNSNMLSEEERAKWSPLLQGKVGHKQAINVTNKFLDERRALNTQEAKNYARSQTSNPAAFTTFKYLQDDYQQQSSGLRDDLQTLDEVENLLNQPQTGATNKAITAKVSQLFGKSVRAMAELNEWKHLGDLGQRIGSHVKGFFEGTRPDSTIEDIKNLVSDYRIDLEMAHNTQKAKTYDQANTWGVQPNLLFPDADDRFVLKIHNGKKVKVDTWLKTVEVLPGNE